MNSRGESSSPTPLTRRLDPSDIRFSLRMWCTGFGWVLFRNTFAELVIKEQVRLFSSFYRYSWLPLTLKHWLARSAAGKLSSQYHDRYNTRSNCSNAHTHPAHIHLRRHHGADIMISRSSRMPLNITCYPFRSEVSFIAHHLFVFLSCLVIPTILFAASRFLYRLSQLPDPPSAISALFTLTPRRESSGLSRSTRVTRPTKDACARVNRLFTLKRAAHDVKLHSLISDNNETLKDSLWNALSCTRAYERFSLRLAVSETRLYSRANFFARDDNENWRARLGRYSTSRQCRENALRECPWGVSACRRRARGRHFARSAFR